MYGFGTILFSFSFLFYYTVRLAAAVAAIEASSTSSTSLFFPETNKMGTDLFDITDNEILHNGNENTIISNRQGRQQYLDSTSQMNNLQNIITGIFKLLNGSVKIKTNTAIESAPVTTRSINHSRINNRGPPQISDLLVPTSTIQLTETPQFSTVSFPLPTNLRDSTIPYSPNNVIIPWSIVGNVNKTVTKPPVSILTNKSSQRPVFLTSSEPEIITKYTEYKIPSPSIISYKTQINKSPSTTLISSIPPIGTNFVPKPGIVIDDVDYKSTLKTTTTDLVISTIQHAPGDIFDITVSAVQGLGGNGMVVKPISFPGDVERVQLDKHHDIITKPIEGEGFVSIDGKRTYLNLFDGEETSTTISSRIIPTKVISATKIVEKTTAVTAKPTIVKKPNYNRKVPLPPTVRIDTCIVGDDSTCDQSQNEICRTESNISSCHCRPGFARNKPRESCRPSVSMLISVRIDRVNDRRILWVADLRNEQSELYQHISYELGIALESALSMTPFGADYLKSSLNNIYRGDKAKGEAGIFANLTLQLVQNSETVKPSVKNEIQKQLLGVIQRRSNNLGISGIWVNTPIGSISNLQDLDECAKPELNDCHRFAKCINVFGTFTCRCDEGYRDQWHDNRYRSGRKCEQCSAVQNCNNRGECRYQHGQPVCQCNSNYFGSQCEIDGEVLMVSIGACVAAIIIIILTLVFLIMWSRKWSHDQKTNIIGGSPVFNYMTPTAKTLKGPILGAGPYPFPVDDVRMRWASYPDVLVQNNHYAPEPVIGIPGRPTSTIFGYHRPKMAHMYGTLPNNNCPMSLPPIPLPRLTLQQKQQQQQQQQFQRPKKSTSLHNFQHLKDSTPNHTTSSDDEDRTDLLRRNFNTTWHKSQLTPNNQNGIYYDVDYEQNELQQRYKNPTMMSLNHQPYSLSRPYYRN